MCKIEFHDLEFRKMKGINGIELLKFNSEKVLQNMQNDFKKCVGTLIRDKIKFWDFQAQHCPIQRSLWSFF